jgi:polyphosphate glucokinase
MVSWLSESEDLRNVRVLVVDVGGSNVKLGASGTSEVRRFRSGKGLGPDRLVREAKRAAADWQFDAVALTYPGVVDANGPVAEPGNLACGWLGYDFGTAFGCPVRIANDAVVQALGAYEEGRMLFLGLGTGLGSALVSEHVIVPLELGCLMYIGRETMAERLGRAGRRRHGQQRWLRSVARVVPMLRAAFAADCVVLGGGNAKHVHPLPRHTRRGGNEDAIAGGFKLWEELVEPHDRTAAPVWRVVK